MKFTKKPIEVEARQFTDKDKNSVHSWASSIQMNIQPTNDKKGKPALLIPTAEGEMLCSIGDWLIKEPNPTDDRKFYPCKPDIFKLTYDPVPEESEKLVNTDFINSEAKLVEIGFEHSSQSTPNFTEYKKIVNGVTWAYITRSAGNDYLTKDGEFACHVETWSLLNNALDLYKLRD